MKKSMYSLLAFAVAAGYLTPYPLPVNASSPYDGEAWYNELDIVEENREYAHSNFIPYQDAKTGLDNEQSTLTKDLSNSDYYASLNGEWDFKFAQNPDARESDPDNQTIQWNTEGWDKISVPSSIQAIRNEDGSFKYEPPIYSNQRYPWQNFENVELDVANVHAPTVNNSVGHYQRTFTIDENWDGRQIFVSFQGVESAFYVYINGQKVGYGEDSYTADDFNITPYLNTDENGSIAGQENTISVQVYRWSTGSYLENQDFIRMSGIFRDVFLYSKDKVELRDFFIHTDLDENNEDATLRIDASVRNLANTLGGTYTVEAQLYSNDDETPILAEPITMDFELDAAKTDFAQLIDDQGVTQSASAHVENPKKWFADTPNLYRVVLELKDSEGNVIETAVQRIGFRKFEKVVINDAGQQQMQINGKKIMFRGTNRHETALDKGRAIGKEEIVQDLTMMKEHNINAIRTSHYPNAVLTYELADEFGFYVCDEANIETHMGATASNLPNTKEWNEAVMSRTQNMVERDKNNTSVLIWSLGNEATYQNYPLTDDFPFWNSTRWILEKDPSRIRKYERQNRYGATREESMVDVYSSQYWDIGSIVNLVSNPANKLPYIQSEYAHSMGNALANLKEYWDVFRTYDNAQGGFIWDWVDQSIETKLYNTESYVVEDSKTNTQGKVEGSLIEGRNNTKALEGSVVLPVKSELNANSNNGLTLDAWVRFDGTTGGDQAIISKGESGYNLKVTRNGAIEFFVNGWYKGTLTMAIPSDFTDGNWKHLSATCDQNGILKLYYNGKLMATSSQSLATAPFDTNNLSIGIGYDPEITGRGWNGAIDSVKVLNRALSEEEIASIDKISDTDTSVVYAMDFAEDKITNTGTDYEEDSYWGYGGDWNDKLVNDANFCGNGIVNADRTIGGKVTEAKKVYQEVNFYNDGEAENGTVRMVNEFLNTNLNKYNISWKYKENNKVLAEGSLTEEEKNLAPLEEKEITLNLPQVEKTEGYDYFLEFEVTLKEDQIWAGEYSGHKGDVIAYEQLNLDYISTINQPAISNVNNFTNVEETDTKLTVTGNVNDKEYTLTLDKTTGYITSYTFDGKKLLNEGPVPNYYRARIDDDMYEQDDTNLMNTKDHFNVSDIKVVKQANLIQIDVTGAIEGNNSPNNISYQIYGNGEVVVTNTITPSTSINGSVKRIGMKLNVPAEFTNYKYYGRGPWENYIDRNTGALIDVYSTTVDTIDAENKYLKPQENGNRTDVRWAALTNDEGVGFMIAAENEMSSSVSRYEDEDMANKRHMYEVDKSDHIVLNVDEIQRGVGGAACGPGPLNKYTIKKGQTYSHTFRFVPITTTDTLMEASNKNTQSSQPVKSILVDGKEIEGFDVNKDTYELRLLKGSYDKLPVIDVITTSDDVIVEPFEQPVKLPTSIKIKATSAYGITKTYTINMIEVEESYVSDMEWTINESGYFENSRDVCDSNPISLYMDGAIKQFTKGVGVHAPSRIGINIDGKGYTNFRAIVGINSNQTGPNSDIIFKVIADGEEIYNSGSIKAMQSKEINVDVTNRKQIELIADMNGVDFNDHGSWADARFTVEGLIDEADYSKVDEAIASVPEDLTIYTEESRQILQDALDAVVRDLGSSRQNEVDAMAEAIVMAIDNLEKVVYTVTVNGETAVTGKYNEKVKVTAPVEEGKEFTGWLWNGKLISTEAEYTFFLSEDMELTPCYEEKEFVAQALLTNTMLTRRADEKADIKFVGQLVLPDGYKIKNAGLIWTSKDDVELIMDGNLNSTLKPTYITKISNTNQFSVTIKGMPKGKFIKGRIFAELLAPDGTEEFVYSDEKTLRN